MFAGAASRARLTRHQGPSRNRPTRRYVSAIIEIALPLWLPQRCKSRALPFRDPDGYTFMISSLLRRRLVSEDSFRCRPHDCHADCQFKFKWAPPSRLSSRAHKRGLGSGFTWPSIGAWITTILHTYTRRLLGGRGSEEGLLV